MPVQRSLPVGVQHLASDHDLGHAVAVEVGQHNRAPVDPLEEVAAPLQRPVVLKGDQMLIAVGHGDDLGIGIGVDVPGGDLAERVQPLVGPAGREHLGMGGAVHGAQASLDEVVDDAVALVRLEHDLRRPVQVEVDHER